MIPNLKNTILLSVCFGLLPLVNSPLHAQAYDPDKSIVEIQSSMEENLTWNLRNALALYFPENTFVIRANVKLKQIIPQNPRPPLPDILLNKELRNLPGLPYVPDDLPERRARTEQAINLYQQVRKNNYDVRKIRVNVLLDENLSDKDRAFIQRYVTVLADINPARGDQVRIESLTFPSPAEALPDLENHETTEQSAQPPIDATAMAKSPMNWLPWVIAAVALLLLGIGLFLGVRALLKRLPGGSNEVGSQERATPFAKPDSDVIHWADVTQKKNTAELHRLKSETIDTIVGTPGASARVFRNWIDRQEQTGSRDVATVLAFVSRPLLELVAPHLGSENVVEVQKCMDAMTDNELREKAEPLLRQFDRDVRQTALETRENAEEEDALAFLNQMTDDQLQHLLKPLKQGVKAIVLAQIRPNRAAKLLDKMDGEERTSVLAAMGDIDRIPVDVYRHLARQLASRANEIEKMRYVRANGVDALVKVLDHLNDDQQTETLSYLQTQNLDLAQKVTQKFMTFNQLFELPVDKIREVALTANRDVLAKSLVNVDEKEVNRIVDALPERLRELVEASLEANHDLTDQEVAQARRSLMRSIRDKQTPKVL